MVNIHLGFDTPNFLLQEVKRADVPWRDEIITGAFHIVQGYFLPPKAPGIGVEVGFAAASRHPFKHAQPEQWSQADGWVADW